MKHASLPSLSVDDAEKEIMSLHEFVKEKYGSGTVIVVCFHSLTVAVRSSVERIYVGSSGLFCRRDRPVKGPFDQGYENGYTAPILDTLKEKNVKAVFFLTGDYAERNLPPRPSCQRTLRLQPLRRQPPL